MVRETGEGSTGGQCLAVQGREIEATAFPVSDSSNLSVITFRDKQGIGQCHLDDGVTIKVTDADSTGQGFPSPHPKQGFP